MQFEAGFGRSAPRGAASSAYLLSWVALAAFGLGYIGVAATRPEMLGAILPIAESISDQSPGMRMAADLGEEVAALRRQMHELQHEVAATKSVLQEQVAQYGEIAQRLAAAEERIPLVREARIELPPPAVQAPTKAAVQRLQQSRAQSQMAPASEAAVRQPQAVAAPSVPVSATLPTGPNVKLLNSPPASSIATGTLPELPPVQAPPAPTFGPAKVTTAAPRAIEIGSADSLEGLRVKWGDISGKAGDVLGMVSPRYRLATDGRAAPFTLLAGPFDTPADAARACNSLRTKGVTCRVGAYSGNSL